MLTGTGPRDNSWIEGLKGTFASTGGTMNAIGNNQVEPDFAVTIPHPTRKADPPNLNNYRSYTFGGLVAMYEDELAQRFETAQKRNAAENKCEAKAKRICELEKDIAYAREAVEIANNTIIGQQGEINGLRDINRAQKAEINKLREQLKKYQAANEIECKVKVDVTGLEQIRELSQALRAYDRLCG
jgi:septal ring factor EnvC (AmiA/AmiB activator)